MTAHALTRLAERAPTITPDQIAEIQREIADRDERESA